MQLHFTFENNDYPVQQENFLPLLKQALSQLGDFEEKTVSIEVHWVTPLEIQSINSEFRGKDQPTDVISFALEDQQHEGFTPPIVLLGEIYLCYDVIVEQAQQLGKAIKEELQFIFLHGVLHLLGFDHPTDEDQEQMNQLTAKILSGLRNKK